MTKKLVFSSTRAPINRTTRHKLATVKLKQKLCRSDISSIGAGNSRQWQVSTIERLIKDILDHEDYEITATR